LNAFERTLRSAYAEVLIDDLDILRRFCAQESGGTKEQVARALSSISFLPARARFPEFSSRNKIRVQPTRVEVALDGDRATNRRLGR
jgi:hypothetical protein